jgi:hypothetical protein
MDAAENQIVVCQQNETVRLDVRLENETVWLTQNKCSELEREGTCSILEYMGKRRGAFSCALPAH